MRVDPQFNGDDLRRTDPKFQPPRYAQYLKAVERLDQLAQHRYGKRVVELAIRWLFDQPGVSAALWGARRPDQLAPVEKTVGWTLGREALADIDQILTECITNPVGPEFMAPSLAHAHVA